MVSPPLVIRTVQSWRDRRRFQRLPWSVYRHDPRWVPPLLRQERRLLGWDRHPFFDHAEMTTLLALRGGEPVGRLAVLVNHLHNREHQDRLGFFGFFECLDDPPAAGALFEAGRQWLRRRGMTAWRGPLNPSQNYTCGLLVDGFERPPTFLMTYNPPYYPALLESAGFHKAQDLYAYEGQLDMLRPVKERYHAAVQAARARPGVTIRRFRPDRFERELRTYIDIYNQALRDTWGFVPIQPAEAGEMARGLRHLIDPRFTTVLELDGRAVGVALCLPDYNPLLRRCNGRLWPLGWWKLWRGRRHIRALRAMAMTMLPGHQRSGWALLLLAAQLEAGLARGMDRLECSWVLESNTQSRGTLERVGLPIVSRHRIYEQPL